MSSECSWAASCIGQRKAAQPMPRASPGSDSMKVSGSETLHERHSALLGRRNAPPRAIMIWRRPFGYFTANLAGGLASFGAVFALARLLSPADYGFCALALTTMGVVYMLSMTWVEAEAYRFADDTREGQDDRSDPRHHGVACSNSCARNLADVRGDRGANTALLRRHNGIHLEGECRRDALCTSRSDVRCGRRMRGFAAIHGPSCAPRLTHMAPAS